MSVRYIRNASTVTLANTLSAFLGALAIIATVRHLDVAEWGVAAVVVSGGPLISLALSLGTVTHGVKTLSQIDSDHARGVAFGVFIGRRTALALLLVVLGLACVVTGYQAPGAMLILGAARFFRGGTTVLLSSERRFFGQSFVIVGEKLLTLASVVWFLRYDAGIYSLPLAQISGALAAGGFACALSGWRRWREGVAEGLGSPHRLWRGSGYFGATSLAAAAQQLDVLLVAAVANPFQAGLFAAAARIPSNLNVIGSALALVILPTVASGSAAAGPPRGRRTLIWLCLATCIAVIGAVVSASSWVPILLGPEYRDAVMTVRIYLVAVVVGIFIQPAIAFLQALGDDRYGAKAAVLLVVTALVFQAAGASVAGAEGAAVGYLIASSAVAIMLTRRIAQKYRQRRT